MGKRIAVLAVFVLVALGGASSASARFLLVNPWGQPMPHLQRMVDKGKLPQPNITVTVWPLSQLPGGNSPSIGGMDFWGQRPFLIALGSRPSPDELWHELGHVVDDGWQTPGQRCAFERVFAFAGYPWFFPDGSDAVSDNWAQSYAAFAVYGARVPLRTLRSWTAIHGPNMSAVRGHLYRWVLGVARRSTSQTAAVPQAQVTSYCG